MSAGADIAGPRSAEQIDGMSIKELKQYIAACGADSSDCVEKADLKARARECAKKFDMRAASSAAAPPKRTPKAPRAPAATPSPNRGGTGTGNANGGGSGSGSAASASPVAHGAGAGAGAGDGDSTPGSAGGSGRKRMSVFRAKKFVASKVGDTKAGRATLIKVIGEEGDEMIQALKSAVIKYEDRNKAKELKHDSLKFIVKAYNLWKHKDLTPDDAAPLRRPAQMEAERFLQLCASCGSCHGSVEVVSEVSNPGELAAATEAETEGMYSSNTGVDDAEPSASASIDVRVQQD